MPDAKRSKSLKSEVLDLLHTWHPETVRELTTMMREKRGIKTSETALIDVLRELRSEGILELEASYPKGEGFLLFLRSWELTRDFWVIAMSAVILNITILFSNLGFFSPLRWSLGTLAVLLFPGYSIQMCLFPKPKELLLWKRILLGIGLSVAAVGFYAVILDATTQGIVLGSVQIVLTVHTLIFASIGLLRRYEALQIRTYR